MIPRTKVEEAMYEAMRRAAVHLPPDVEAALRRARDEEVNPLAIHHLESSLENARQATEGDGLVCGDTGFPLYFVRAGARTSLEGGFGTLWRSAEVAVARATSDCFLRPTMVDPLTRANPGDNCGPGMPKVEIVFSGEGDGLEFVAAPKGGGSEIFGNFYKMLYPSDGVAGIKKFVIDSIKDACYAGKVCPPAILGVGVGGSADLCMKMAKEAALLRPVGQPHPRKDIADLERDLLAASRMLGIGPMGAEGVNAVMGLHIQIAVTHTAALPVAVNAQCLIGRRWRASISGEGEITYDGGLNGEF